MLPQRRRPEGASIRSADQEYKRLASGAARRRQQPDAATDDDAEDEDEGSEDEEERWRQHSSMLLMDDHDHNYPGRNRHERDEDDSSLSIAQSGCQSILSAWRQRVSRASQRNQHPPRPTSVLSNATSACSKRTTNSAQNRKRGKSPASHTRIPLGPRHVQHFVTNTRRRRQADELVLNALEARRRAFQLQRQQTSLYDDQHSPDFLQQQAHSRPGSGSANPAGSLIKRRSNSPGLYAGSRLSLSPSPLRGPLSSPRQSRLQAKDRCAARASPESPLARRSLVASSQPETAGGNQNNHSNSNRNSNNSNSNANNSSASSPAGAAQRQRLLRAAADPQVRRSSAGPPLAKLDQNSSDLCSQNSSRASSLDDDHDARSSYSSSGSQFTQLVTGELAPDCAFLDLQDQVRCLDVSDSWREQVKPRQRNRKQPAADMAACQPLAARQAPRSRSEQVETPSRQQQQRLTIMKGVESEELDDTEGGKLRRGALKRDSIRRLRLNRQQQTANYSTSSVSSELTPSSHLHQHPQPRQPLSQQAISSTPQRREPAARSSLRTQPLPRAPSPAATNPAPTMAARAALQRARSAPETGLTGRLVGDENEPPITGSNKTGKQELNSAPPLRYHRPVVEPPVPAPAPAASLVEMPDPSSPTGAKYFGRQLASQMSTNEQRLAAMRAAGAQKGREAAINHLLALREGSKSRDDLRFDAAGNRLHQQLSESWREERSPNQLKSMSQRIEIIRSETNNISPPPAFADPVRKANPSPKRHVDSQSVPFNTTTTTTANNKYPPAAAISGSSKLSTEQPVATTRKRAPILTQNQPPPPVIHPKPKQLQSTSLHKPEESLPRLESSADDEFKKRIEKLRMMARANSALSSLASRGPTGRQTGTSSSPQKPMVATRPMSISNWSTQPPATTNLDALMLASNQIERRFRDAADGNDNDRQSPANLRGAWRRSNSSLARTSLPASNGEQLQQPPKIPSPAPVKLMVKERSAPKPDFAFVAPQAATSAKTSQPPVQQQQQQQQHKYPIRMAPVASSSFVAPADQPPSSRLRSASPKSPDFGGQPSSSNEDSAIASSVSSPSLSYMMNSGQHQHQQLPNASCFKSPQPPSQFRSVPTPPPALQQQQQPDQVSIRKAPESGALQSILRRQQQQFGALDRAIVSADMDVGGGPIKRQVTTYQEDRLQSPMHGGRPEVRSAEPQPQPAQQHSVSTSSPAKRVHFNDLASVRSFESISSQTSNSTAVPNEVLRQQVGSPDSMASSSGHSRLSSDSPDLLSACRDGAAIYAIRGDPELELDPPPLQAPMMIAPLLHSSSIQPPTTTNQHKQQQQQQHLQLASKPTEMGYTLQRSALGYQPNPLASGELHQQQPVLGATIHPATGFINMTAPPATSLRPAQQVCEVPAALAPRRLLPGPSMQMSHTVVAQPYLHQVLEQPTGMQLPRHLSAAPGSRPAAAEPDADDDEDPNYALRLRQASTRGAAYPGFGLQQQQAPLKAPPPVPRRLSSELCNFQTEV